MAEHADKSDAAADAAADEADQSKTKAAPDVDWANVKDRFIGILAGVVRWVCLIFALILVLHIVFVVAEANPDNTIVEFMKAWADRLTLGFKNLFLPEDPKAQVLVNYGIAAVVWLVISAVGSGLIRRVGGMASK